MASAGVCHEVPNGMPARLFDVKLQIWLRFPAHEDSSERTLSHDALADDVEGL